MVEVGPYILGIALVLGAITSVLSDEPGPVAWILYSILYGVMMLLLFGAVQFVKMMWLA